MNSFHEQKQTLEVKESHFAYSTPRKTLLFRSAVDLENMDEIDDAKAGLAPKQIRAPRSHLSRKRLEDISVALFTSEGENWPRRDLFMEMDTKI